MGDSASWSALLVSAGLLSWAMPRLNAATPGAGRY